MTEARPDAIDRAANLDPDGPLFHLRAARPSVLSGVAACREAVLDPRDDLGLPADLRRAIVARVAAASGVPLGAAEHPVAAAYATLAGGGMPADPRLAAIARHADMIARHPGSASADDLAALTAEGITTAQIVALSELLGFAAFEARLVQGLKAVEPAA